MADFLAPVGPPKDVTDPMSRKLIGALYEHDWYAEPVTDGRATVVSPGFTRVLVLELDGEKLIATIDGERKLLSRAIEYVKGE